jgi:hypothetical protein
MNDSTSAPRRAGYRKDSTTTAPIVDSIIDATIDINVVTHLCEHNLDVDSNHSIRLMDDEEEHPDESLLTVASDYFARPIVVGYAFGPKKMSTMGVVMAEASKAKLTTVPEIGLNELPMECGGPDCSTTLTRERLCQHHEEEDTALHALNYTTSSEHATSFLFDTEQNHGDLRHIVQHVRALCSSSMASSSSSSSSYGVESSCSYSSRGSRGGGGGGDDHSRHTVQTMCSTTPSSAHTTTDAQRRRRRQRRSSARSTGVDSATSSMLPQALVRPRHHGRQRTDTSAAKVAAATTLPIRVSFVPLDPGKEIETSNSLCSMFS